jgi:uncharacterized protein YcbK (DUF882 family)
MFPVLLAIPLLGGAPIGVIADETRPRPNGAGAPGRGGPIAHSVAFTPAAAWAGLSGALAARAVMPGALVDLPLDWGVAMPHDAWYRWLPLAPAGPVAFGEAGGEPGTLDAGMRVIAPQQPGSYTLEVGWGVESWRIDEVVLLVKRAAAEQQAGRLNGYRIGAYPNGGGRYARPAGFIEVTRENRDLAVSRSFRLADFLTKDQFDVWPKYVLIDPLLLDKLELVLLELRAMGVPAERMHVMSGYRTPRYNAQGVGGGGRASMSRHQYGDAADVWIETLDRPGRMADLNGDGRVDTGDVRVILAAVDRVEAKYPHLVGGAGVYPANAVRPPFLHIDVRGQRSRW